MLERDAAGQLAELCVPHAPRALALMDGDRLSRTYGCMDRAYWYYRTITSFASATWQQPMVGLAALARTRHPANRFADDAATVEAARAALVAWTRAQHRNGAFDEWYRNEHSYCPTAITTAGAVVAADLLGDALDRDSRGQVLEAARRAGRWLSRRYNPAVMNQNLASAVALAGLARMDGGEDWRGDTLRLLDRLARDQNREGWFPEYGGFDFGYSTLALDFLALVSRFGFREQVEPMAARLAGFLTQILDRPAAVPGRLGSRGASHAFPFGAIEWAAHVPAARGLADTLLRLHAAKLAATPATVDDRYFAYFYFPAFCLAYHAAAGVTVADSPAATTVSAALWPDSGLAAWRSGDGTVLINRRLGGAAAVLRSGAPALYHLGYTVTLDGRRYSSAGWRHENAQHPLAAEPALAQAQFTAVSGGIPLRRLMIPFQIVVHLLVSGRIAELFQRLVKRLMINHGAVAPLTLERRVSLDATTVAINDVLRPARPVPADEIAVTTEPTMHSPSARQDGSTSVALDALSRESALAALRAGQSLAVRWVIDAETGRFEATVNAAAVHPGGAPG